jgi:hypothetical protein
MTTIFLSLWKFKIHKGFTQDRIIDVLGSIRPLLMVSVLFLTRFLELRKAAQKSGKNNFFLH